MTTEYDDEPTDERTTGGGLRAKLEEALARVKELEATNETSSDAIRSRSLDDAFAANGLSQDEGFGKAVARSYEGKPTPEALAKHLSNEYEYVFGGEENPLAPLIAAGYARLDAVGQVSSAVDPVPSEVEQLAEAKAQGNWERAGEIQANQMVELMRRQQP